MLREIVESDADNILRVYGDAEHMKRFGSDPIRDLDGAAKLIAAFASWRKEPVPVHAAPCSYDTSLD